MRTGSWLWPLVLAVFIGGYALFLYHNHGHSPEDSGLRGAVTAIVFGVLCYLAGRWHHGRRAELTAGVYGAVFGIGLGFLLFLSGETLLRSSLVGFALGASMGLSTYYFAHMRGR
ncbi:hypothetical protein SCATT_02640 [Streptantibioticus cattleyicolor NRRL 8057 = DSM 46488]|uniref:Transmembrane protein n=1 Tax=Streptantibioticus cattleyicolor (strain ATCC 35852 / DSM 46488 / JCM 4925 / NBRC 14057 / NRRL 8057) TaxID=1003195 RepID=G8WMR6_STREN|nr:hypothetical protein SCATT_02640 [Streptantibioticus cattleyicolor NRRL 8057 = DSM 46488]